MEILLQIFCAEALLTVIGCRIVGVVREFLVSGNPKGCTTLRVHGLPKLLLFLSQDLFYLVPLILQKVEVFLFATQDVGFVF